MAHHVEPMDVDTSVCDFDNKENTFLHGNVLSRSPCTEKGHEELDVSELNMKLRYSATPAASSISKSYTASGDINLTFDLDKNAGTHNENGNMTRSMNSTMSNINAFKPQKALPLQNLITDQPDPNRNILLPLDSTVSIDGNVTVKITNPNDIDDIISYPSSSSSLIHTPEATTPTKDISKGDESPIMRGLKSVLSMFRPSQSPIPTAEDIATKAEALSPPIVSSPNETSEEIKVASAANVLISTPIAAHKTHEVLTKRNSPTRESIVFKDNFEKQLQWEDETTVLFSDEKIHKLWLQESKVVESADKLSTSININHEESEKKSYEKLNRTVENMDISYNKSIGNHTLRVHDKVNNSAANLANESDSEFVDCETTLNRNDSQVEQSFQSLDYEANNTFNPIEQTNLDGTIQSSDGTMIKSPNFSTASTDTTIMNTNEPDTASNNDNNVRYLEKIKYEENKFTIELNDNNISENLLNLNCNLDPSVFVTENVDTITNNIEPTNIQSIVPKLKSIDCVASSLSQIPLIADPRILLFNVSLESHEDATNFQAEDKTPADVPLPDDEDGEKLVSLPLVNFVQENIGNLNVFPCNALTDQKEKEVLQYCMSQLSNDNVTVMGEEREDICNAANVLAHKEDINRSFIDIKMNTLFKLATNSIEKAGESHATESISETTLPISCVSQEQRSSVVKETLEENTVFSEEYEYALDNDNTHNPSIEIPTNVSKNMEVVNLDDTTSLVNLISSLTDITVNKSGEDSVLKTNPTINKTVQQDLIENQDPVISQTYKYENYFLKHKLNNSVNIVETINDVIVDATSAPKTNNDLLREEVPRHVNSEEEGFKSNDVNKITYDEPIQSAKCQQANTIFANIQDRECQVKVIDKFEATGDHTKTISQNEDLTKVTNIDLPIVSSDDIACGLSCESDKQTDEPRVLENKISLTFDNVESPSRIDEIKNNPVKNTNTAEEKIVTSENNSPFVSVTVEEIPELKPESFEEIENTYKNNSECSIKEAPSSPPIFSKGYNFIFEEIDNPFATKTKIRASPPPGQTSNQSIEHLDFPEISLNDVESPKPIKKDPKKNRRKSEPGKKKPVITNKKLNATFVEASNVSKDKLLDVRTCTAIKETINIAEEYVPEDSEFINKPAEIIMGDIKVIVKTTCEVSHQPSTNNQQDDSIKCTPVESFKPISSEYKNTLSSEEQSIYYSAGTSSIEGESKSVFNIPEIDDRNFNSFATKSRVRESPPPDPETNLFSIQNKLKCSLETKDTVVNDTSKNISLNTLPVINKGVDLKTETENNDISRATSSSRANNDDIDVTNISAQEVHTEDEDTVEGPFLETGDLDEINIPDYEKKHIDNLQFTDFPMGSEENSEGGELFIDAEAFEFLLNKDNHGVVDSGKESLFLKFDPLFAKRMSSEGVVAALSKYQKKQSTSKKIDPHIDAIYVAKSPDAGPSIRNATHVVSHTAEEINDEFHVTVSKPMMVVNPAVVPVPSARSKATTPVRSNRRSLTFTSPAIAVIDRLLSMSANNSLSEHDATVPDAYNDNEAGMALTQLRELLADKEINVYNLKTESKELKKRLSNLESQMKTLEHIGEERLKNINELNAKLNEKTKINKSMAAVVEEYERTIASLIAENEQDKKRHAEERIQLMKERDEQTAHLTSMEISFSDLHSKYEKSKQVILGFKSNEDALRKSNQDFEENLKKMQNNYELLKQHATSKLNNANEELQKLNKSHDAEVLKLNAMIKRKELHITSLEETLLQKTKANDELTAICDELINKVG